MRYLPDTSRGLCQFDLRWQIAAVTGSSKDIGKAIPLAFAKSREALDVYSYHTTSCKGFRKRFKNHHCKFIVDNISGIDSFF